MTFSIKWHPKALKILESLPKETIKRVLDKLDAVAIDPWRYVEHFEGDYLFKLRIGGYRALLDINRKENVILVKVFDHRSKVYLR